MINYLCLKNFNSPVLSPWKFYILLYKICSRCLLTKILNSLLNIPSLIRKTLSKLLEIKSSDF